MLRNADIFLYDIGADSKWTINKTPINKIKYLRSKISQELQHVMRNDKPELPVTHAQVLSIVFAIYRIFLWHKRRV